uniref:Uncharacterized protein n=1 Tax=Anopheles culicifacies TaxID=139723 RepID=A0A182LS79_9DIPT
MSGPHHSNEQPLSRFSFNRMVSLLHKSIPDGTDRTLSVPNVPHSQATMLSASGSTETEDAASLWSTTTTTTMETFTERCLACTIGYAGSAHAERTATLTTRTNWTWSFPDGLAATGQQHPNLTASEYDTLDTQDDFPPYEIDPAYQLRYSILGTVLLT